MPLKGRTKQDVLLAFRRDEILDAARRLCAARGFRDTTVDHIARAAGVAKGTVYLYFRSKQDIYWAMIERGLSALSDQVRQELARPAPIEERIHRFIESRMAFFEAHHDLLRLYENEITSIGAKPPRWREHFTRYYLEQMRLLQGALEDAVRERAVRPLRTDLAAHTIFEVTRSAVWHRVRGWSTGPLEDDIQFTFDFIWKGLSGS